MTALLSKRLEDLLVPPVEGVIIDGLNRGIARITHARDAMRDAVETWESERELLRHVYNLAKMTFDEEWEDAALKERAIRTAGVAKEMLSWTPENMLKSVMKEKRGEHSKEA